MGYAVAAITLRKTVKQKIKRTLRPLFLAAYIPWLKWQTFVFNKKNPAPPVTAGRKNLYVVAAGAAHKHLVARVVQTFGHDDFDYIIVSYDGTSFDDEIFKPCRVIYEPGISFEFIKKYTSPDCGVKYAHIFLWDDDIDIGDFDYRNFLEIFRRNNLQMAQPALTSRSHRTFELTVKDLRSPIGRYTDFVEVMMPVIRGDCWPAYWNMIEETYNYWGFGYDSYARSVCGFINMGIIDRESVTHVKPVSPESAQRRGDYERLKQKYNRYMLAKIVAYGQLR